jgi:hypothetical protein
MVFKIQDGKEFATKAEWRAYMIDTYYSIRNRRDEKNPIIKQPGSISGQTFDISDCSNCRIVVMDYTEQIQIDNVQNCRIFLGACASTIFVRNCDDCTIFSCSRQIRLRECFNSSFYVFSMSEVHIELSKNVVFAPFAGGYREHKAHLDAAGLQIDPVSCSMWRRVYDHNDFEKTNENWHLLPVHDRILPWFPDGSNLTCFPSAEMSESSFPHPNFGQVGETFGVEKMISDSKLMSSYRESVEAENPDLSRRTAIDFDDLPMRSAGDGVKQLGVEVALLIAAATAKGIDVAIWLTDVPGITVVPAAEFNTKLKSLGLAVGIHESWEAKRELDLATSKTSLKIIFSLCGHFTAESGTPVIDVSFFLRLALERVEEHLQHIELASSRDQTPAQPAAAAPPPPQALKELKPAAALPAEISMPPPAPAPSGEPSVVPSGNGPAQQDPLPQPAAPLPPRALSRSVDEAAQGRPRARSLPRRSARSHSADGRRGGLLLGDVVLHSPRRPRSQSREPAASSSRSQTNRRSEARMSMVGISSEELESVIKQTVQKTDLYHLIQVGSDHT